jgi:hypothetical protein
MKHKNRKQFFTLRVNGNHPAYIILRYPCYAHRYDLSRSFPGKKECGQRKATGTSRADTKLDLCRDHFYDRLHHCQHLLPGKGHSL